MPEQVGFIGLGIMGSRQAANLARAGYELTVYNRTRERAETWAREHGATVADSPAAVAERADVVISMVVDGRQVRDVLLAPGVGALARAVPGTDVEARADEARGHPRAHDAQPEERDRLTHSRHLPALASTGGTLSVRRRAPCPPSRRGAGGTGSSR